MKLCILYRGGIELRRLYFEKPPDTLSIRYDKPPLPQDAIVTSFVERFEKHWTFCCPNCKAYVYNSVDFMRIPDWLDAAERTARPILMDTPGVPA